MTENAHDQFDLSGRVAVVTGALGLLGKQHALALAAAGAKVVLTDVNGDAVCAAAGRLSESAETECLGVGADISDPGSVDALRDAVLEHFDAVDVLVNNAAVDDKFESPTAAAELSRFENYPFELWQRMLSVNVTGTFLCCQRLGSVMAQRGSGSIINIASTYGVVAPQQSLYRAEDGTQRFWKGAAYPTTKGAVLQLTRFLASYWGGAGVRVNALSPGGVENGQDEHFQQKYSERTMLGRMARPSDYRGALVFLASDASAYVTGTNLVVDGGWTAW